MTNTSDPTFDFGMTTIFDEVADAHPIPLDITSGAHESFVVYDGVTRGIAVLARCSWRKAMLGFKVEPHDGDVAVTLNITLDDVAHRWWGRKFKDLDDSESRRVRHVTVRAAGDVVGGFTIGGEKGHVAHTFVMPGNVVNPGGLLIIELDGYGNERFESTVNAQPLLGLQLDSISIRPAEGAPGTQIYVHDERFDAASRPQGCVVLGDDPATIRFRVLEQPRLPESLRGSAPKEIVGRGIRKAGVLRRTRGRRTRPADRGAVERAFPVLAEGPDGKRVDVGVDLVGEDVLQLTFAPMGERRVVFFELNMEPSRLDAVGFKDRVAFERVP